MNNNLKNLIPISTLLTLAICIVILKNMIVELNDYQGLKDIFKFMIVQFVLTFNIYIIIKLNMKGK